MTRTMWAVGHDDGQDWVAVAAETEDAAIASFCRWEDCSPDFIAAVRVPKWDALEKLTRLDWFDSDADLTTSCSSCGEYTSLELGGEIIEGQVFCEDCKPPQLDVNG